MYRYKDIKKDREIDTILPSGLYIIHLGGLMM